jgi:quercetin dioxygenase-like cupin family protein
MRKTFEKSVYTAPIDQGMIEQEWRARGFSFGVFRDPPGQEWNDFVHATDEFVIVAAGTLEVTVGGESAQCEPGDLVWIPRGTNHSLKTLSQGGSVWLYGYGNDD